MALSADRITRRRLAGPEFPIEYPVKASEVIYKGAIVAINSAGYAVAATDTAGETVVGIAERPATGGASSGDVSVPVLSGASFELSATGTINAGTVGALVYVSDDETIDDSTANSVPVGVCTKFVNSTTVEVFIPVGGVSAFLS